MAPASLGAAFEARDPDLVIAEGPNVFAPGVRPAWFDYRPYEDPVARACVGGRTREIADVGIEDLIAVADEVRALLADPGHAARGC